MARLLLSWFYLFVAALSLFGVIASLYLGHVILSPWLILSVITNFVLFRLIWSAKEPKREFSKVVKA